MAKEHPDFPRLLEAMKVAAGRARPWAGTIFRSAPPKWATGKEMLTGVGSMKSGARFNAPGSFPAIYGSTTPELAMIESLAYQRRAGLPLERAMPLVFKAISVDVQRCVDLSTALAYAGNLARNPNSSSGNNGQDVIGDTVAQQANRIGEKIIDRELDVQPTITIRQGWPLRVLVEKDMILEPYVP